MIIVSCKLILVALYRIDTYKVIYDVYYFGVMVVAFLSLLIISPSKVGLSMCVLNGSDCRGSEYKDFLSGNGVLQPAFQVSGSRIKPSAQPCALQIIVDSSIY